MKPNYFGSALIDFLKDQDDYLLESKTNAEKTIRACVRVSLTNNQEWALVSFIISEGIDKFRKSKLLKLINKKDLHAADEFDKYIYYEDWEGKRIVDPFLVSHRELEKSLFLMPEIVKKSRRRK